MNQNRTVQPGITAYQEEGNNWQEIKKERLVIVEETGDCSSIDMYKMETRLEEDGHWVKSLNQLWT
jgi:hypothetical protein